MPTIDWTQRELIIILAGFGVLLIVLSLLFRYRSAKRGSFLAYAIGISGGLLLGTAGGLCYLPPDPDWFTSSGAWYTVDRGDVVFTAVESGELGAEDITHVVCKLHASRPGGTASTILWIIDEGKMVKKGDLLVLLDDSEWKKQLQDKAMTPARRNFLEEQIANCRIVAPCDGLAIYYRQERHMGPGNPIDAVSQGEPVKEGQRLLWVFDPAKLAVKTQFSKSQIAYVRLGHMAHIHIDRFPNRTFAGQVSHIARTPTKSDPPKHLLYYEVGIKLSDPVAELRPGMVKISLELARLDNVLRVPTETLLHSGTKTVCLVKSGRQIEIRMVNTGLSDSQFTAVGDGLKQGEQVLRGGAWQRFSVSAK